MRDAVAAMATTIDACVSASVWSLPDPELIASLDAVHQAQQRLAAVQLTLVRELDARGVAVTQGASSTPVWLRERLRMSIRSAHRLVRLAAALDRAPGVLREALAAGAVTVEQAQVIAAAVTALPDEVGSAVLDKATATLVDLAGQHEPRTLGGLGERILAVVAPEAAEEAERQALERAERRAFRDRYLSLTDTGDGAVRIHGRLGTEAAATVRAALDPLCVPGRLTAAGDERTPGQRRADALVEVCRLAMHTATLPDNGGDRPQVVLTVGYDVLLRQLGAAQLDTGQRLSAETARRLACDATILPAVLDGAGQPLDLGRQRRLVTGALRRVLVLRDGGCAFPGCDRPPRWCDAHHLVHWSAGGLTSLANCALLCGFHHRLIHHSDWTIHIGHDGRPEFIPPAWIDPTQQPRRNTYHRRQ
jgi:Domain of unknown function (DUF222)